jgi:hypothetical protein
MRFVIFGGPIPDFGMVTDSFNAGTFLANVIVEAPPAKMQPFAGRAVEK